MLLKICFVLLPMEPHSQDHRLLNFYFIIGPHLMPIYLIDVDYYLNLRVSYHFYFIKFNSNTNDALCTIIDDLIPFVCQRESCPNAGNAEATKVCYDHNISITYAPDSPPPLYLCIECANEIHRENTNQIFGDILHPMAQVSMICENKVCFCYSFAISAVFFL